MICASLKLVNVEIFVASPIIITYWRDSCLNSVSKVWPDYPGTHPLKSLPTQSYESWYIENFSSTFKKKIVSNLAKQISVRYILKANISQDGTSLGP